MINIKPYHTFIEESMYIDARGRLRDDDVDPNTFTHDMRVEKWLNFIDDTFLETGFRRDWFSYNMRRDLSLDFYPKKESIYTILATAYRDGVISKRDIRHLYDAIEDDEFWYTKS